MNVLTLLFIITPGFLADFTRRAIFGERKTSDFERTVHSIVLSVVGLGAYLAVGKLLMAVGVTPTSWLVGPPYLAPVLDLSNRTPIALDWRALFALLYHTLLATLSAISGVGAVRKASRRLLSRAGRSLESSWFLFWSLYRVPKGKPARWVTIISGDSRTLGRFISASDPAESKDVVLGDPLFWDEERKLWRADGVRVAYFPEGKVEAMYLSATDGETVLRGHLDENFQPIK